jgi:hypothetical protein
MILTMNIRQNPFALAAILWVAVAPMLVCGQDTKEHAPFQFSCVVWKDLPYPELLYRQGEEFLPLELPPRQRSQMYPLKGQEAFELYVAKDLPDGKPGHELVGKAALRAGTGRMLFMIQEAADKTGLPLAVYGLDDSLKEFPMGSCGFLYITNNPLQVEIAGVTDNLPPQRDKVVTPEIPKLGGFLPFFIRDAKGNIGFQTRLFGQPRGRKMVIIVPPKKESENLAVLFLPEIISLEVPIPEG